MLELDAAAEVIRPDSIARVLRAANDRGPIPAGVEFAPGATVEIDSRSSHSKISRTLSPVTARDPYFSLEGWIPGSDRFTWEL